jgi:hypothetical protein
MRNRTLERAQKKARKVMEDLEGEGMFTSRELKFLLEREIENRLGQSRPSDGIISNARRPTDRAFTKEGRPPRRETST